MVHLKWVILSSNIIFLICGWCLMLLAPWSGRRLNLMCMTAVVQVQAGLTVRWHLVLISQSTKKSKLFVSFSASKGGGWRTHYIVVVSSTIMVCISWVCCVFFLFFYLIYCSHIHCIWCAFQVEYVFYEKINIYVLTSVSLDFRVQICIKMSTSGIVYEINHRFFVYFQQKN